MINGNKEAVIQVKTITTNDIGEQVKGWADVQTLSGWLDYQSGDSRYTTYNAKIQESTHVFIADYVELDSSVNAEYSRMMIEGKQYDIVLIDNPMELNRQLEFYLKYTGGQ